MNERASTGRRDLAIRLIGVGAARDGQGALVRVVRDGAAPIVRRAGTGGSYLSAGDPRVSLVLGTADRIREVVVEWRAGEREAWPGTVLDAARRGLVTLTQGTGRAVAAPGGAPPGRARR